MVEIQTAQVGDVVMGVLFFCGMVLIIASISYVLLVQWLLSKRWKGSRLQWIGLPVAFFGVCLAGASLIAFPEATASSVRTSTLEAIEQFYGVDFSDPAHEVLPSKDGRIIVTDVQGLEEDVSGIAIVERKGDMFSVLVPDGFIPLTPASDSE